MPLITTTKGLYPTEALRKVEGVIDNDDEHTTWVEYWDGDELVHRSAHVHLKKAVFASPQLASFG